MIEWILIGVAVKETVKWLEKEECKNQPDQKMEIEVGMKKALSAAAEQFDNQFEYCLFSILGKIASADNRACSHELDTFSSIGNAFDVSEMKLQLLFRAFEEAQSGGTSAFEYAEEMIASWRRYSGSEAVKFFGGVDEKRFYDLREAAYGAMWEMAMADKFLHSEEDKILRDILFCLELPQELYHQEKSRYELGFVPKNNSRASFIKECSSFQEQFESLFFTILGKISSTDESAVELVRIQFEETCTEMNLNDSEKQCAGYTFYGAAHKEGSILDYTIKLKQLISCVEADDPAYYRELLKDVFEQIYRFAGIGRIGTIYTGTPYGLRSPYGLRTPYDQIMSEISNQFQMTSCFPRMAHRYKNKQNLRSLLQTGRVYGLPESDARPGHGKTRLQCTIM